MLANQESTRSFKSGCRQMKTLQELNNSVSKIEIF